MIDSTNPRVMADNIRHLSGASGSQASDISTLQTTVTSQGNAITALGTYSTDEIDTGMVGLNNEKIYRKVFFIESLPNNTTSAAIPHGIENLHYVYRFDGSAFNTNATGTPIPFAGSILPRYTSTNITIQTSGDYSTYSGILVMEYDKATTPAALTSPAPDDTRSIEPEIREEDPEAEPVIDGSIEEPVKKTTRKKTTTE